MRAVIFFFFVLCESEKEPRQTNSAKSESFQRALCARIPTGATRVPASLLEDVRFIAGTGLSLRMLRREADREEGI